MSAAMLKLQILARAELALLQIRAQRLAGRTVLFIVAAIFALFGLAMFNLAAFHALSPSQGPAVAALIVALIDAAVTVALILAARQAGPEQSQEKLAREMRDLACTEINRDIEQVRDELVELTADIRSIGTSFRSFSDTTTSLLTPLLGMLVKSVKKS